MSQMCHQTLQGTQCTGARLYLWPVVQTKRKVTPLVSAAVNASPGEQMGVCSPSGPLPAVLHAPTALGGARGDVCVCCCLVRWHDKALHCGFVNFSTAPKTPNERNPFLTLETVVLSCYVWNHQKYVRIPFFFFFFIPDLQFKKYSDTHTGLQLFVKWLPASPGRPRVQLIPHAWAKYHLCLFGNKGGTC